MRFLDSVDAKEIERLLSASEFFWLDLDDPSEDELTQVGSLLGLHELALEDSREFGQRPKLDVYSGTAL